MRQFDIFIVGGGINGCGIARDAVGRGYSVGLAEMKDLASGTSSWSTKLIHGGLRYLEHYEFKLVRHALLEREVLWAIAPHIVRPLRFILPHHKGLRPAWLLRLGLFLYDHIGGRRRLKGTETVDLGAPLKPQFRKGFEYSDARVDDARLVVLNARDAARRGAAVMVGTAVISARREGTDWSILLRHEDGAEETVRARTLVNTGGPWVDRIIQTVLGQNDARHIRLVQGSHLVMRRLYAHDRAYIFQNADGRIVFTIPYQHDFTLVGTTDRDYEGDPADSAITEEETQYLLDAVSEYFAQPLKAEDIVWTYAGVRPLFDNGSAKAQETTRDYVLRLDGAAGEAPVLHCFGGKLTTYRVLAEDAIAQLEAGLGTRGGSWTGSAALPGGDFPVDGLAALERALHDTVPELEDSTVRRAIRCYGTDAARIFRYGALGRHFGHGLYACEVAWLVAEEWARTTEDILWRRTKLGLHFTADEEAALAEHLAELQKKRKKIAAA